MRSATLHCLIIASVSALAAYAMSPAASAGGYISVGSCGVSVGYGYSGGYYHGSRHSYRYHKARARTHQRLYGYHGVHRGYGHRGYSRHSYRKSGYYISYPRRGYVNYSSYGYCGPTYYGSGYWRGPGTYTRYGRVPDGYSPQPHYAAAEQAPRERMYAPRHNAIVLDSSRAQEAAEPTQRRQTIVMDRAWLLLEAGRADRALAYFSSQANADLNDGVPKVGYALSAALNGDHKLALWAMRRAFGIDPQGAMRSPMTDGIRKRVENLAARYGRAEVNADWSFMLASCRLLLGETELAKLAIDDAIALGDESESASNVLSLVAPADMYGPSGESEMASPESIEQAPTEQDAETEVAAR